MKCWGRNYIGQLGSKVVGDFNLVPTFVKGVTAATSLAGGNDHTCAVLEGGSVTCWGNNKNGQLGNGTTSDYEPVAVDVIGVP